MQKNQFARVFNLENGQILITRVFAHEENKPAIRIETREDDGPAAAYVLGYETNEARDYVFKKFKKEHAQQHYDDLQAIINTPIPENEN